MTNLNVYDMALSVEIRDWERTVMMEKRKARRMATFSHALLLGIVCLRNVCIASEHYGTDLKWHEAHIYKCPLPTLDPGYVNPGCEHAVVGMDLD